MLKVELIHRNTNARIIKTFIDFTVTRTGAGWGGAGNWPRLWSGFDPAFFEEGITWEKVENSHFCHHISVSTDSWSELQTQDSWALTCLDTCLYCLKVKVRGAQSRSTPYDPMDCSSPGSTVRGISQARILDWVAISFSRGSSWPRDLTHVSLIAGRFFTVWVCTAYLHQIYPGH